MSKKSGKLRMAGGASAPQNNDNAQIDNGIVVANQFNYKPLKASNPTYDYQQKTISDPSSTSPTTISIGALTNIQGYPLGVAGVTTVGINLPIAVINLSRCYFEYDVVLAAPAAGLQHQADAIVEPISGLRWGVTSGQNIVDIKYGLEYQRACIPLNTTQDQLQQNTAAQTSDTLLLKTGPTDLAQSNLLANDNIRADGTQADFNYTDPLYTYNGAVGSAMSIHFRSPLSRWKGTLFSLDKDLPINVESTIYLDFPGTSSFSWTSTTAGVKATQVVGGVITNFKFHMAVETNLDVKSDLLKRANSGNFKINCPRMINNYIGVSGQTQTPSFTFKNVQGSKLQKVVHAIYNPTRVNNTCLEHKNMAGTTTISSYNTYLDTVKQQQILVDCTTGQDYMVNMMSLKGSVIRNYMSYQYNWVHIDDYSNGNTDSNVNAGRDLTTNSVVWYFETNFAINPNVIMQHFNFAQIGQQLVFVPNVGLSFNSAPQVTTTVPN